MMKKEFEEDIERWEETEEKSSERRLVCHRSEYLRNATPCATAMAMTMAPNA